MVAHSFNLSTQEAEAGIQISVSWRPALSTSSRTVKGHIETLPQKPKEQKEGGGTVGIAQSCQQSPPFEVGPLHPRER